jgi:hypothetical protein
MLNPDGVYTVYGTIYNQNGAILAGAGIDVKYPNGTAYYSVLSTGDGSYAFYVQPTDPNGVYAVNYSYPGYVTSTQGFTMPDFFMDNGNSVQNDVALIPDTGLSNALEVNIYDTVNGYALNGASVQLWYQNHTVYATGTTQTINGVGGKIEFTGMQDGTYIIYATMNNYKESYKAITFFGGGWATTDVGLNRVNPCASPIVSVSVAPTVSVNPSASVNPLNPNDNPLNFIQDWYILLGWLGITEDVAAFLTGAMIIIGFGLGAIWLTAKAGIM